MVSSVTFFFYKMNNGFSPKYLGNCLDLHQVKFVAPDQQIEIFSGHSKLEPSHLKGFSFYIICPLME